MSLRRRLALLTYGIASMLAGATTVHLIFRPNMVIPDLWEEEKLRERLANEPGALLPGTPPPLPVSPGASSSSPNSPVKR